MSGEISLFCSEAAQAGRGKDPADHRTEAKSAIQPGWGPGPLMESQQTCSTSQRGSPSEGCGSWAHHILARPSLYCEDSKINCCSR